MDKREKSLWERIKERPQLIFTLSCLGVNLGGFCLMNRGCAEWIYILCVCSSHFLISIIWLRSLFVDKDCNKILRFIGFLVETIVNLALGIVGILLFLRKGAMPNEEIALVMMNIPLLLAYGIEELCCLITCYKKRETEPIAPEPRRGEKNQQNSELEGLLVLNSSAESQSVKVKTTVEVFKTSDDPVSTNDPISGLELRYKQLRTKGI